ncbi:hypothetical protein [Methanobacterium aggregans]|uniref:hypothetical protein n=1 Tax=Methanobacterium aggregans TaxID=1615586 RepID=UPI001AE71DB6|nr:hypothetical protein [Methanobacterium aggregans]MBP2046111.1 hypothetical protein [Methanobacterium aggregans]
MVDVKEIISVDIVPFTLMTSSIQAILALIFAIIFVITFGSISAFIPQSGTLFGVVTALGLAMIVIYPIGTFLFGVVISFLTALFYNILAPRVGGIKLGFEGYEVKSIPVVPFSLIMAFIEAVWAFIIGILLAAVLVPLTGIMGTMIPLVANETVTSGVTASLGAFGAFGALFLIVGLPIIAFVMGFIAHALFALFYNLLIPKVGGIKLELNQITSMSEIKSIPVVPASVAIAIIFTIFGFIIGLLNLVKMIMLGYAAEGVISLVVTTVIYFVIYFIMVAVVTLLYNFLAPNIGRVKLELK